MLSRFPVVGLFVFALLFTGCGGGTTTGTGGGGGSSSNPVATLSGSALSFSSSTPNQATAAQTITLTNNGSATLNIAGIALSGTNASNFAQTTTCGAYLAQNASCNISVTFTPATAPAYSATITVTDNSGGNSGSTQTISLTGALTAPQATLSASTLTFTGVNAGTTAAAQSVTLTNGGSATLNISSITLGGTNAAQFAISANTCGSTLAAGANCSISATFTPATAAAYGATITIADNASGSPQVITLSGTGVSPGISLSQTSITFPASAIGVTTSASTVTLTNNGTAALSISSIALSGTNTAQFGETTTCGATLAVNASCNIAVTFTPAAATTYTAKVLITDNATGSPQTITLSGAGAGAVSYTFYAFPLNNSVQPLYDLVNGAQHTIDITMYALQDTTFVADLVNACKRGVVVRVILDQNNEKSNNTPTYTSLNAQSGCSAVWANKAFQVTHQKSIVVDNTQVAIMSLNLQSQYYTTTRDYALIENDAADIAAIEATFNMDYAAGTPASGVAGASDLSYQPGAGDTTVLPGGDLIWSPTTAQAAMTNIIANAQTSLIIENEEMASSASYIVNALVTACQTKKLDVKIAMVNQSSYATSFNTLKAAGCKLHLYPDTNTGYYIHAKAVIADYGQSTQSVYMGSINYSNASMTQNRELGMYITDSVSIGQLYTDMMSDYNGGTPY